MARTFFAPNPFYYQGPIRDPELFFNREADVGKVLTRLRKGQSVSVIGREKIGKTSFLHHISTPQVAAQYGLEPKAHLFFYVDCERLAALGESDCFRQMRAIMEKIVSPSETRAVLPRENSGPLDAYYWLEQTLSLFKRRGIQAIMQLDDFDFLVANARVSRVFLDNLRALAEVHSAMTYLTTSRVPLADLEGKFPHIAGSPFFNIFWEYELQPFNLGEAHRFLITYLEAVGAVFPQSILSSIFALGRGEPYRLQLAGACAYDTWHENLGSLGEEHLVEIEARLNDALRSEYKEVG